VDTDWFSADDSIMPTYMLMNNGRQNTPTHPVHFHYKCKVYW